MFSAQRVRVTRKGKPGEGAWAVYRRNLDGSEPGYYLSNAPEDTMLETLACRHGVQRPRSRTNHYHGVASNRWKPAWTTKP